MNQTDTNYTNDSEMILLHLAQIENIARSLLKHGVCLNPRASNSMTPLYIACSNGFQGVVSVLLEYGAEIEAMTSENLLRPLHLSLIGTVNLDILRLLLNS